MSNFNLNDELLFKDKYMKYKNKYIDLKQQLGSGTYKDKQVIVFYNHEDVPKLDEFKLEYYNNSFIPASKISVNGKEKTVKSELEKNYTLYYEDINGLPNIFTYKLYENYIQPLFIYNFDKQLKLLRCIENDDLSKIVKSYINTGSKESPKISAQIKNSIVKYVPIIENKTKSNMKVGLYNESLFNINKEFQLKSKNININILNTINPLNSDNIETNCNILMEFINERKDGLLENTNQTTRLEALIKLQDETQQTFANVFSDKLIPQTMIPNLTEAKKIRPVDSYIIIKYSNFNTKLGGITFTIEHSGNKNFILPQTQTQPQA